MMAIRTIRARAILDSRGNPTVEVDVHLDGGAMGRAAVPSGASTGKHEAIELRDDGKKWGGKGVRKACGNVNGEIAAALQGMRADEQTHIDSVLCELDGTPNKQRLGANAILGVSLAVARAAARARAQPLWHYLGGAQACVLPMPMFNILNGGAHADNKIDVQEFMLVPLKARTFADALEIGAAVFHALKDKLRKAGHHTGLGDEGGFAPDLASNRAALDMIMDALRAAGLKPRTDVALALDPAASEFYKNGRYRLAGEGKTLSSAQMVAWYADLAKAYPIVSIEDGMAEGDGAGWEELTRALGEKMLLVGDDIFVTNPKRLAEGIQHARANAILIKPNQCGTLSETLATIRLAQSEGWRAVVSHRSGETEDTFIADLAVATNCGLLKAGSLARSERLAKYNRLLRIGEELGGAARYAGREALRDA